MADEQIQSGISEENLSESNKKSSNKVLGLIIALVVVAAAVAAFATMGDKADPEQESATMVEDGAAPGEGTEEDEAVIDAAVPGEGTDEEGAIMDAPAPGDGDDTPEASVKEFSITGENFKFSQNTITVKKGDTVRVTFTSTGGFHDWMIDEFNARTAQVNTGDSASVEFTADKAGEFEFYCSVDSHRALGMVGKLIVEE